MARHGLTCDNLLSADIVTADGQLLTANASQHDDLFWAVSGDGGNFGIVTSFEYGATRVRAAYGRNYDRLVSIKRKYDAGNLFRVNNNISPSVKRA